MSDSSDRTLITDSPPRDDSYTRSSQKEGGPTVVSDDSKTERTGEIAAGGNPNSDKQLELDEKEAINTDNIIKPRTRAQDPKSGVGNINYKEPEDLE